MKRVLIIAYYWPPNAGVGVYRWLKFCKYLPEFGWQPVVYTPSDPEMQAEDPELLKEVSPSVEVIKEPITEPYGWYKRFTGKGRKARIRTAFLREEGGGGWREDLALWVRSNFFVPDARLWWVRPSIRRLEKYLAEHPVDVIVSTGSPHSLHLIGHALRKRTGIPWLADFRDPWTNIDFYNQLKLGRRADAKHRALEGMVLRDADQVTTVSWRWAQDLKALGARDPVVLTNGYDRTDLPNPPAQLDERWSLVHVGSLPPTRDVPELWNALGERLRGDPVFRDRFVLRLVGPVDHGVRNSLEEAGIMGNTELVGQVGHAEAVREMQRARVLLLPVNDTPNVGGFLPAKVFEYLSVQRPILAVAPLDADITRVLGMAHTVVPRNDADAMSQAVAALFTSGQESVPIPEQYDRRVLTSQLSDLLDRMTKG